MLVISCPLFIRPTPVVANFGGETAGKVSFMIWSLILLCKFDFVGELINLSAFYLFSVTSGKLARCFTTDHPIFTTQHVRPLFTHSLAKYNHGSFTTGSPAPWSTLSSASLLSTVTPVSPQTWGTISAKFIPPSASHRCSTSATAVPVCTTPVCCTTASRSASSASNEWL